jgi:DNA-binding protein HU-beta
VKNKDLIDEVSKRTGLSQEATSELADRLTALITKHLSLDEPVSIQGFGTFEVKKRKERLSVNPTTGVKWLIPPKWVPSFKVGPTLKEKIKQLNP